MTANKLTTVLAVDDDHTFNFLTEEIFQEAGIRCDLVFKPMVQEALDYLTDTQNPIPELILLDINMPVLSGWDFLDVYRERSDNTRAKSLIVMLSTSVYEEDKQKAMTFPNVVEYVEKPLTGPLLERIMKQYFC